MGTIKFNVLIFLWLKICVALVASNFFFAGVAGDKSKGLKWESVGDTWSGRCLWVFEEPAVLSSGVSRQRLHNNFQHRVKRGIKHYCTDLHSHFLKIWKKTWRDWNTPITVAYCSLAWSYLGLPLVQKTSNTLPKEKAFVKVTILLCCDIN